MTVLRSACLLATGAAIFIALAVLVTAMVALFARTQKRRANAAKVMDQLLTVFAVPTHGHLDKGSEATSRSGEQCGEQMGSKHAC
jgi:hypothetical protein